MRKAVVTVVTMWVAFLVMFVVLRGVFAHIEESAPDVEVPGFEAEAAPTPGEVSSAPVSELPYSGTYQGSVAPEGFEAVTGMDVDVTVQTDGDLTVVETVVYDFANLPNRHGIYRFIPVRFRYDDRYDRIYPIEDVSVTGSPGTPTQHEQGTQGNDFFLKIGDPNRLVEGTHTYTISYTVKGALNAFEEWDELYWNVVGDRWDVGIRQATATVRLERGEITAARCFAGPTGTTFACQSQDLATPPASATFGQDGLSPHAGMTVVVAFPKGTVTSTGPILEERWSATRAFEVNAMTAGASAALFLLGTGLVGGLLWFRGRDRRYRAQMVPGLQPDPNAESQAERLPLFDAEPAPVEYRPPDGIRPGQVGTLIDEVANPLDVTATIVDLAVRQKLIIEEIPKEGWFGKTDWNLKKLTDDTTDLQPYEYRLFKALFSDGSEVKLSDLKNTFHTHMAKVQDDLYVDMVTQGWFPRRPDKVRTHWGLIGTGVLVLGAGLTALAAWKTTLGVVPLGIVAGGILLLATSRWMPHRTPSGTLMLRRVKGFERFMETAETERMAFAEEENVFARYLPYAIVFDLVDKWAKAFEGIGQDPGEATRYFYAAPYAFNADSFASAMDNFATTTSGTLVSTPSSSGSSGFSGGSSGGGGGGGGGGSW